MQTPTSDLTRALMVRALIVRLRVMLFIDAASL
jgi:hypothetical protein